MLEYGTSTRPENLARSPTVAHNLAEQIGRRRTIQSHRQRPVIRVLPNKLRLVPTQYQGFALQVGKRKMPGKRQFRIHAQKHEHPAPRAARYDAFQPQCGRFRKIHGKIGHHQHSVRFGQLARRCVVLLGSWETPGAGRPGSRFPCAWSDRPGVVRYGAYRSRCGWPRVVRRSRPGA